ncbi:MAG: ferrous iron transport protein A [Candidatus Heimdallarchaeota archaeon]|nr:ferrous iron transport protein A [Candidatus Heimdallarchaeota archaeon]MCK5047979.1 ferrous iron transport protein A [Candidatus Heimdallarchaeota archaeon]
MSRNRERRVAETFSSIPLAMVNEQTEVVIRTIRGGRMATRRLHEMGFLPGEIIRVIRSIGYGPIMVSVKGSHVALGHRLAMKIMVSM